MAARKTTLKPKPVARRVSARKAPAKTAAVKETSVKKAAAKTTATKRAPAKKSAGNKTTATSASVDRYLAAIKDPARRKDCEALCALMAKATRHPPQMWGTAIVGFGSYHYRYDSGREGDFLLVGFSSRASEIALYGLRAAPDANALLAKLGKHKEAKGCVYVKAMADVDAAVLARLVATAAVAKQKEDVGPAK